MSTEDTNNESPTPTTPNHPPLHLGIHGGFGRMGRAVAEYVGSGVYIWTRSSFTNFHTRFSPPLLSMKPKDEQSQRKEYAYHVQHEGTSIAWGIRTTKEAPPKSMDLPEIFEFYIKKYKNQPFIFFHTSTLKHKPDEYVFVNVGGVEYICDLGKPDDQLIAAFLSIDVFIDFSTPQATLELLKQNLKYKKPVVIGTTGFTPAQREQIKEYSQEFPIVFDANMSIGMNLLLEIISIIKENQNASASILRNLPFNIDIRETHHTQKKDGPSGTAYKILELIIGEEKSKNFKTYQSKMQESKAPYLRSPEDIGITYERRGSIIGEHSIILTSDTETLEFSHKAITRKVFAEGAVRAALWLHQSSKTSGWYDMKHVLHFDEVGTTL